MNPSDFFSRITSKGDIAAACLGFATGFMVDVFLFPVGVPPGTTASVFAVGAIGLKNSVAAALDKRKVDREEKQQAERLSSRASRLLEFLSREPKDSAAPAIGETLSRDIEFWKLGVLSDAQLEQSLTEIGSKLRAPVAPKHVPVIALPRFAGLGEDAPLE